MKLGQYTQLFNAISKYKIAGIRTPIILSFLATTRCPFNCSMCGSSSKKIPELPTERTLQILDEFTRAGMVKIIFTGGEVFIREDFGALVGRCKENGISVNINTSGYRLRDHALILKNVDSLHLSLDGPEEVNDRVRFQGSYRLVADGVEFCKSQGVRVGLMCTINKLNVGRLKEVADFALEQKVPVSFHLAGGRLLRYVGDNPARLTETDIRNAISEILEIKDANPFVANTMRSLEMFAEERFADNVKCLGGYLFVRMEPDGRLRGCGWDEWSSPDLSVADAPVLAAMKQIPDMKCRKCLCESRFELNLAVQHPFWASFQHILATRKRKGMRDLW